MPISSPVIRQGALDDFDLAGRIIEMNLQSGQLDVRLEQEAPPLRVLVQLVQQVVAVHVTPLLQGLLWYRCKHLNRGTILYRYCIRITIVSVWYIVLLPSSIFYNISLHMTKKWRKKNRMWSGAMENSIVSKFDYLSSLSSEKQS